MTIEKSYAVIASDIGDSSIFSHVDDIASSRGMWRCEPGVYEIQTDEEFFTIVEGQATVKYENGSTLELNSGMTGYFKSLESTLWTVTSTIIKTYQKFSDSNCLLLRSVALDVSRVILDTEPMEPGKSWICEGNPNVSSVIMATYHDNRVLCGIWKCSIGSVAYVEEDEIFTVIEGKAIVTIHDGSVMDLFPGVIGEFKRGDVATFKILEPFTKTFQITLPSTTP